MCQISLRVFLLKHLRSGPSVVLVSAVQRGADQVPPMRWWPLRCVRYNHDLWGSMEIEGLCSGPQNKNKKKNTWKWTQQLWIDVSSHPWKKDYVLVLYYPNKDNLNRSLFLSSLGQEKEQMRALRWLDCLNFKDQKNCRNSNEQRVLADYRDLVVDGLVSREPMSSLLV